MESRELSRVAVLFTGGKDSTYVCELLKRSGYGVSCLITVFSVNQESYMLHTSSIEFVELSAKALGIPLFTGSTDGKKEEEIADIARVVAEAKARFDFAVLASGAIASKYQKVRVDKIASESSLVHIAPLWGIDQARYLKNMVEEEGYSFVLTSVSAGGLDGSWLGKEITSDDVRRLGFLAERFGFNMAFEGGEAETLVLDCPAFSDWKLKILRSEKIWNGYTGRLLIREARLDQKR